MPFMSANVRISAQLSALSFPSTHITLITPLPSFIYYGQNKVLISYTYYIRDESNTKRMGKNKDNEKIKTIWHCI